MDGPSTKYDDVNGEVEVLERDHNEVPPRIESVLDVDDEDEILIDDVERFLRDLEHKMTSGQSLTRRRWWAKKEYKINDNALQRYEAIIRGTWRVETTSFAALTERRDHYRQLYMEIYRREMDIGPNGEYLGDSKTALKAVDAMTKLDGLTAPDVTVSISAGAVGSSTVEQLTNRTRQRTQELLQVMRERATKHAMAISGKIADHAAQTSLNESGAEAAYASTVKEIDGMKVIQRDESDFELSRRGAPYEREPVNHDDPLEAPSPRVMGVVR